MNDFFKYGEEVAGYDVRVVNEREARAAAGILFALGLLSLTNAVMIQHGVVTRYFISFFTLDFLIRVINPSYSPSMLLGRFFVQNQKPEYVGATQKRFAWGVGLMLALPMFYYLVINWQPTPIKVYICILCLVLLLAESAFSICVGCKIYNLVMKNSSKYCPGGICEIRFKDKIQTFNPVQKTIVGISFVLVSYASYAYLYKLEHKTLFGKTVAENMMSEEAVIARDKADYERESAEFDRDDDF
ncbi:DUF4395 domain-containing protein [Sulfurimonas sp. SAG-AH-194-C21]|nr:DUF4395 domain-containing protein [Sulfurimonas sp. SAG-AH-194-C21]MDF1883756.1 DUF4395 domain-containing protein [Sulfurimonas sp. SAG-AH-194-C21]